MEEEKGRLTFGLPVKIVQPQAVYRDEPILIIGGRHWAVYPPSMTSSVPVT